MNSRAIQDFLIQIRIVRRLVSLALLCRASLYLALGQRYLGFNEICRVARIADAGSIREVALTVVRSATQKGIVTTRNMFEQSFLGNDASTRSAMGYTISGGGPRDIWRDVIVLKSATANEMGVILLKYTPTFEAVMSVFDLTRLMERYVFVLEPSWAGYCDPSILMFIKPGRPVIVQCFTEEDHRFIADIGTPLIPVRLGPADWVDAAVFKPLPESNKVFDLVMIANWGPHKRHRQLFKALQTIRDRKIRVLLVGFPWSGRSAEDVMREASAFPNDRVDIEIVESVPQTVLARLLSQCKALVFLSRKEGDNKAVVEAMFANVPVLVYDKTIGGARNRVNSMTGVLSSDRALAENIRYMLSHYERFAPREWALAHTGSGVATKILNDAISEAVLALGGRYTTPIAEKMNTPNLTYRDPTARDRFAPDYAYIDSCRRGSSDAGSTLIGH